MAENEDPRDESLPEGFEGWPFDRRRIWRLERQALIWERLAFAAIKLAREQATRIAELSHEPAPLDASTDEEIFRRARLRWRWPS